MLGSQLAMPILVINMGGEMIYILHQRLQAQNIDEDKSLKVLEDVIRTMYTPAFLEELFKPQEMYSSAATKQIFDKLAHSSIMRLNKTSMDKLYDLMTMGIKYQLLSCASPHQYLQLTISHLEALETIIKSATLTPLVQSAISLCIEHYSNLNHSDWYLLQQTLFQFFQGRKVKVSLFLQNNMQNMNGVLMLNPKGNLPYATERPGQIRYFENNSQVRTDKFPSTLREDCAETREFLDVNLPLGKNLYCKTGEISSGAFDAAGPPSKGIIDAMKAITKRHTSSFSRTLADPKSSSVSPIKGAKQISNASAKAELSLLAGLLGIDNNETKEGNKAEEKPFKINLFPNQGFNAKNGDEEDADDKTSYSGDNLIVIDIDARAGAKTIQSYMNDLDLTDRDDFKASAKETDDDDLLALMDSAK